MDSMVIVIDANGSVEHTLKDSFFDTRFLGERTITRLSEVLFDERAQQFYIKWLQGPNAGNTELDSDGGTRMFDTYEDAVSHEILTLNNQRSAGLWLTPQQAVVS